MNRSYYLKDIIEIYPLESYIQYPNLSDYLTQTQITTLTNSGFYNTNKITNKIKRKYQYDEIATSDISQFYDLLNELIEENLYEYVMNLITISEDYSIQNVDTRDLIITRNPIEESKNLVITNDTPSNRLNIENIKAGTSASNVMYETNLGEKYEEITHQESTSALNTTQSNVEAQLVLNNHIQEALNKFVNNLAPAFSIIKREYYEEM